MKKYISVLCTVIFAFSLIACGGKASGNQLEGSLSEILQTVYENADFDQDMRDSLAYYDTLEITEDMEEYLLGTTEIDYTEGLYSAPRMNAIAYQCVLLRLPEGADAEAVMQTLQDNADPRKWICVEAESVLTANIGDVVLFIMADSNNAEAVRASFLTLAE